MAVQIIERLTAALSDHFDLLCVMHYNETYAFVLGMRYGLRQWRDPQRSHRAIEVVLHIDTPQVITEAWVATLAAQLLDLWKEYDETP